MRGSTVQVPHCTKNQLQEKERKKKEEEEQKKREEEESLRLEREETERREEVRRQKVQLASEIPDEPEVGEADCVRVLVKLPGGQGRGSILRFCGKSQVRLSKIALPESTFATIKRETYSTNLGMPSRITGSAMEYKLKQIDKKRITDAPSQRLERRFRQSHSLKLLYFYVFCHPESPDNFDITTNFPRTVLRCRPEQNPDTFEEAGLGRSVMLFVNDLDA